MGQAGISSALVFESPLANRVTWCPSDDQFFGQPRDHPLCPAVKLGGTLSNNGATCAIRNGRDPVD